MNYRPNKKSRISKPSDFGNGKTIQGCRVFDQLKKPKGEFWNWIKIWYDKRRESARTLMGYDQPF